MTLLVLLILQLFPCSTIIGNGLANDVLSLLIDCLSGRINIWSKSVKFVPNKENLVFLKTLLLIVTDLATFNVFIHVDHFLHYDYNNSTRYRYE